MTNINDRPTTEETIEEILRMIKAARKGKQIVLPVEIDEEF